MEIWYVIGSIIFGLLVGISVYIITRKVCNSHAQVVVEQAKAKAKAIEYETQKMLQNHHLAMKEEELHLKQSYKQECAELAREYDCKLAKLDKLEQSKINQLNAQKAELDKQSKEVSELKTKVLRSQAELDKLKNETMQSKKEMLQILSKYTQMSKNEAKDILLAHLEEELCEQRAHLIRQYEREAHQEAKRKANYILAQATTRYAGEFANERLINVVNLPSDELKGRIIGKEGRNIKALELISGVDVIIDDTPGSIILSSFNLYRRAIATKTIERLVEDGRIQPARIEEMYERVKNEMNEQIQQDGEDIAIDMELGYMHPELKFLLGKMRYRASFGQNALGHSIEVAKLAAIIAGELGGDEKLARRAGILHDIGKALTQELSGNHVELGAEVCTRYKEHPVVINAIKAHHGYEEIQSIECAAVCAADALSAARPGARRDAVENFLKRMQDIERIAMDKVGVKQAYAINAGREVRVITRAELVNDEQSIVLARDIAKDIESTLQYPGEIKVSVIRETRAVEYAR
ncbi:MAG TPA: ribonuclease Y [Helicobacter sp.]|uniref:Ribonuclease Y n=4 Tax=Helicobacter typhlonius TaxID=76936 RepID=A0A4U8S1I8_9HELI|nr:MULTISPECIES: ribonuclease Y [Helicobacter]TLD79545.1 ribonuclease Y [Helicobacter typhlonius]TLD88346.1 ribonuclease Y [Helicobacter sp. MIT 03-1616]HCD73122.1 ribonuclease Y [Helicobacter sp.]